MKINGEDLCVNALDENWDLKKDINKETPKQFTHTMIRAACGFIGSS